MFRIALKMLIGDQAKYAMLIGALTFATLLMVQQAGVFVGIMVWTTSILQNSKAAVWVVDPKVEDVNDVYPLRDTDLGRVRSVSGVAWAVPLYQALLQARLKDGTFKTILLMGVDPSTLIGMPSEITQGRLDDLRQANAVFLDEFAKKNLVSDQIKSLEINDVFEINDHEARIVGFVQTERNFNGYPFVYTTYERAIDMAPKKRRNLSYVMVEPQKGQSAVALARKIEKETGLKAFTYNELFWSTIWWFWNNTGIPIAFGSTILMGFIVGIAVAGQTFYMFVLDNMRYYGALKAMGATNQLLAKMLILQASLVGFIGYGLGVGGAALFGYYAITHQEPPFYMTWHVLVFVFLAIISICIFAAYLGIRKISKLETSEVFRG